MNRNFFRFGPITRLSIGLTALSLVLLMASEFLFGLTTDEASITQNFRKRLAETVATQAIVLIEHDDVASLGKTLSGVLGSVPEIRSVIVRRADGNVVISRGNQQPHNSAETTPQSPRSLISVPLYANTAKWGEVEISFSDKPKSGLGDQLRQPMTLTLLLMSLGGFLLYYAYLRRAMHYLDPTSAVPERVHKAFDTLSDALLVLNTDGRILLANAAFHKMNGGSKKIGIGTRVADVPWLQVAASKAGPLGAPWERALREQFVQTDVRMEVRNEDARTIAISVSCSLIRDDNGTMRGCLVSLTDQSELERTNDQLRTAIGEIEQSRAHIKAQNEKLQHLASRDPLTGCLNRRAFFEQVESIFAKALRENEELCCIMTDIDHFKRFNDMYGHAVGDRVIRTVTSSIQRHLRQDDFLCRYGGEEFCILLVGSADSSAAEIAERIRSSLEANGNKAVRDTEVHTITASFGISTMNDGATNIEQMIEQADSALYESKRTGRNRITFWKPGITKD